MTITQQLKALLNETYITEDGDEYKIEPLPGLTDDEINRLCRLLPTERIPDEYIELLKFTKGFEFYGVDVTFDCIGQFGFENIFPYSVQVGHDGFGNFWIVDVDSKGNWGAVFYVCHDPAVVVKHSDNLSQFIHHLDEHGKNAENSNLQIIHDKIVFQIWKSNTGFTDLTTAKNTNDFVLKQFTSSLPDNFVIADLRNKQNKEGFAWGKFGPNIEKAKKCTDEFIWAVEKPEKKGIFSRLFGG
jgi:hypothetical protein